jgi:hypothetical protein
MSEGHVPLASPRGGELLGSCGAAHQVKALRLLAHGEVQYHLHACGVASAVMVLNATGIPRPESPLHAPRRYFTQAGFFSAAAAAVKPDHAVRVDGLTLRELGQMLTAWGLTVEVRHADEGSRESLLHEIAARLASPTGFVIANFHTGTLYGGQGGGHFSPLGAWHAADHRWLVLEVARYRREAAWVTAAALWQAMATTDPVSGLARGVLLISAPA